MTQHTAAQQGMTQHTTTKGDAMDRTERLLLVLFGVTSLWLSSTMLLAFAGYPGPLTDLVELFHCLANSC